MIRHRNNGVGTRMAAAMRPVPSMDAPRFKFPARALDGLAGRPGSEVRLVKPAGGVFEEKGGQARNQPTPAGTAAHPTTENRFDPT